MELFRNLLVGGFLLLLAGLAVFSMIKRKKSGKSLHCGGDCKNCGGHCH